jgi:plasmid stabilization system protein ParE
LVKTFALIVGADDMRVIALVAQPALKDGCIAVGRKTFVAPVALIATFSPSQSAWFDTMKLRSAARLRRTLRSAIQPLANAVEAGPNRRARVVPSALGVASSNAPGRILWVISGVTRVVSVRVIPWPRSTAFVA